MESITPGEARSALELAGDARARVAEEVGLPRGYWWAMAAAWIVLGTISDLAPAWLVTLATIAFGVGHATLTSRLLDGRQRTQRLQVSAVVAGRRTPMIVVGVLVGLVAITIGAGFVLHADGARHAGVWAAVLVATVIGFGGPEILRVLLRRFGRP